MGEDTRVPEPKLPPRSAWAVSAIDAEAKGDLDDG